MSDLIYDIGFHTGEDSEFYLKLGYRVVAVEANPALCNAARTKFSGPLSDGRLTLINKALAREAGEATFYVSERTIWSTMDPSFVDRNERFGAPCHPITVQTTTIAELMSTYGVPHFMKVDIEGFDMVAIEGLSRSHVRPAFVSMEADKDSWKILRREISTLQNLGYDSFKIVPQSKVPKQKPPRDLDHNFQLGSSGAFGDAAPGRWLTADELYAEYRKAFFALALLGEDRVAPRWAQSIAWRLGVRADWYDTHARLADPTSVSWGGL